MIKKTREKAVTLAEERAAAKAEQRRKTRAISAANFKKLQRVHDIKEILAPLEAEVKRIKADIELEMDGKGVDVLTHKGMEVVSRDGYDQTTTDWADLEKDYPEIAGIYVHHNRLMRINWKKRFKLG